MGRDGGKSLHAIVKIDFNSHARVGRDELQSTLYFPLSISTHTPAWGATTCPKFFISPLSDFNSHARVGRDAKLMPFGMPKKVISTHTPAWGATDMFYTTVLLADHFNSHARVGRDTPPLPKLGQPEISTHTPAWGATFQNRKSTALIEYISTHTPAWGATP